MLAFMLGMSIALNISLVCAMLYLRNEISDLRGEKEQKSAYEEVMSIDLDETENSTRDRRYQSCPPVDEGIHNLIVATLGKRDRSFRR